MIPKEEARGDVARLVIFTLGLCKVVPAKARNGVDNHAAANMAYQIIPIFGHSSSSFSPTSLVNAVNGLPPVSSVSCCCL